MKFKYIFFCFFLLLSYSQVFSSDFDKEFSIGVNGGLTDSKVTFLPSIKESFLTGYNGGITARVISQNHLGVILELNYSQMGWDEILTGNTFSKRLNYLELPLLTHVYFGKKQFRYFINVGPKIAYLLSEKSSTNLQTLNDTDQAQFVDYRFDYGLCAGGGVEWNTSVMSYIIEGRYYFGLSDLFNQEATFATSSNQAISINLAFLYNFKK
jgi:hypothetical protein